MSHYDKEVELQDGYTLCSKMSTRDVNGDIFDAEENLVATIAIPRYVIPIPNDKEYLWGELQEEMIEEMAATAIKVLERGRHQWQ